MQKWSGAKNQKRRAPKAHDQEQQPETTVRDEEDKFNLAEKEYALSSELLEQAETQEDGKDEEVAEDSFDTGLVESLRQEMSRLPYGFGGLPPQFEADPTLEGAEADRIVAAYERDCLDIFDEKMRSMREELKRSIADTYAAHKAKALPQKDSFLDELEVALGEGAQELGEEDLAKETDDEARPRVENVAAVMEPSRAAATFDDSQADPVEEESQDLDDSQADPLEEEYQDAAAVKVPFRVATQKSGDAACLEDEHALAVVGPVDDALAPRSSHAAPLEGGIAVSSSSAHGPLPDANRVAVIKRELHSPSRRASWGRAISSMSRATVIDLGTPESKRMRTGSEIGSSQEP